MNAQHTTGVNVEERSFGDHPPKAWGRSPAAWTMAAYGEPTLWVMGGALMIALAMILGLLGLIAYHGFRALWPLPVVQLETRDGSVVLGEVTRRERFHPSPELIDSLPEAVRAAVREELSSTGGWLRRELVRIGNFELTNEHFRWVLEAELAPQGRQFPTWALVFERRAWGRFFGFPKAFRIDEQVVADKPDEIWRLFREHHGDVLQMWQEQRRLQRLDLGLINHQLEEARLNLRSCELRYGRPSPQWQQAQEEFEKKQKELEAQAAEIAQRINELGQAMARFQIVLQTADGQESTLALGDVVRAYPANQLSLWKKWQLYLARIWEFVSDEPREANSEGGVFPAIFGTVLMTLLMAFAVTPFGVIAAIYLREYARGGLITSVVRIAVNNLAGVPSIVFGVFGLGFFCYTVGATIDQLFFEERLPNPTYGSGGLLWASLTLALLTLPVVIVATEEALAAVPNSLREGSYACGATKWQTIRRVVLPRAMPGILTGMVLSMARGAGEVAPLMLVGAVKLAPELPIDHIFPYFHPERSFMHLGFHIYDLGFQSQNSEAAKPMVFATAFLLILIVLVLNTLAIWIRARLRRRMMGLEF